MNITKEGIEVKPGQVWKDMDRRELNRHCVVIDVAGGKATLRRCHSDGSFVGFGRNWFTDVSIARMHKGSTGWALVKEAAI